MPIEYISHTRSAFHAPIKTMKPRDYAQFFYSCLAGNILDAVNTYQTSYIDITFNDHYIWKTIVSIMQNMPYVHEYTAYYKLLCWFSQLNPRLYKVTARTYITRGEPTTSIEFTIKNKPTPCIPVARALEDRDDALVVSCLLSLR